MDYPIHLGLRQKTIDLGINPNKIGVNRDPFRFDNGSKRYKRCRRSQEGDPRNTRSVSTVASVPEVCYNLIQNESTDTTKVKNFFDVLFDIKSEQEFDCKSSFNESGMRLFTNEDKTNKDTDQMELKLGNSELSMVKRLHLWYSTKERTRLAIAIEQFRSDLLDKTSKDIRNIMTIHRSPLNRERLFNDIALEEAEQRKSRQYCFSLQISSSSSSKLF